MPKARPVSLFPLSFEEAVKALVRVDPERVGLGSKRNKAKGQQTQKRATDKRKSPKK